MTLICSIGMNSETLNKVEHRSPTAVGGDRLVAMPSITMATSEPTKELGKARGICFTVFNYESLLEDLRATAKDAEYCVLGYEVCPDTKRKHIQGYIHYKNQRSLKAFSKSLKNCHVEVARGSPKQASEYCKKDKNFEEYGVLPVQGHRTDWTVALKTLEEGGSVIDCIRDQPHLMPCQRALRETKMMLLEPKNRDVEVIVLYGKGGVGKTRWAYDHYPDLYKKPSNEWWDGYTGQKTVLLDDFYGWIKYHDLLTVLDRYAINLPYKGGHVWAQYDRVIITSNDHPKKWYLNKWTWPLRRRLKRIICVRSIDGETDFEEEDFPANEEAWRSKETSDDSSYAFT